MVAGIVYKTLKDGDGTNFTAAFWAPDTGAPNDNLIMAHAAITTGAAAIDTTLPVSTTPEYSTTFHRIVSAAASTNATSAKASAGTLKKVVGYNAAASVRYLKFYNKETSPTVGTDTPVLTIALPPSTAFELAFEHTFATGIAYALTTGSADADTGALTAGDVLGLNVGYK